MFKKIKNAFDKATDWLMGYEPETNVYRIPCKWVISGTVEVEAENADVARAYVKTHKVTPVMEDCICCNFKADTEHPILCECGSCGGEYITSPLHNQSVCPYCGNGDVEDGV